MEDAYDELVSEKGTAVYSFICHTVRVMKTTSITSGGKCNTHKRSRTVYEALTEKPQRKACAIYLHMGMYFSSLKATYLNSNKL
jgi:hypothetical protein